mgnify:CR=1 FL=1
MVLAVMVAASGKPVSGPAVLPLRRFPVKVENAVVFVDLPTA